MEQEDRDKIVKKSYILMIGYVLSSIISTIGTILVIRTISVEENSLNNIAYVIPGILIPIGELGLNYASTHFIARSKRQNQFKDIKDIIKINLIIKAIVGGFFTIFVAISAAYISKEIYNMDDERMVLLVEISSIGIISSIFYDSLNSIFLGVENMKMVRIGSIMRTSLRTILSIFLILIGFTLIGPLLGFVLSTTIVVFFYLPSLRSIFPKDQIQENISNMKEPINWKMILKMVKYGYPLLFYSIIIGLESQIFILILSNYGYLTEVAYFNAAVISASLIGILTKSIRLTLFPVFSENYWEDNDRDKMLLKTRFQFSIKFSTFIIVSCSIFLLFFSQYIFPLVYGTDYFKADGFIKLALLVYLLIPMGSLSIREFLNSQKQTMHILIWEFIYLVSSLIYGLILVNYFGAIGIMLGLFLGEFTSTAYGDIIMRIKFGNILFKNLKENISIMIIAGCSGFITFLVFSYLNSINSTGYVILEILLLGFSLILFFGVFLFLTGILSLISEEDVNYFIEGFNDVPILNIIFKMIGNIEKKILMIRNKK